jgi:hypothetical protein
MTAAPDPRLAEAVRTACDDDTPWPPGCAFPQCGGEAGNNCRFAAGFLACRAYWLEQAAQEIERDGKTATIEFLATRIRALAKATE